MPTTYTALPVDLLRTGDRFRINFNGPIHTLIDVYPVASNGFHVRTTVNGVPYGATWLNADETVRVINR